MDLSQLLIVLINALQKTGWFTVIEDDHLDLKQLSCEKSHGPLGVFTRLDLLIMTPEPNPANASGACICFLFYADPTKVVEMFSLGRIIRQDESNLLRSQCGSILNAANIILGNPSVKVLTRPKHQKIKFDEKIISHPAFTVELDYWLSGKEYLSSIIRTTSFTEMTETQIIQSRTEAIYALRGSELQETEEILLDAVADSNSQIRKAGLAVLMEFCDVKYLPLLTQALHDENEEIRQLAGEQLILFRKHVNGTLRVNVKPSVADCLKALEDKNDYVREKAVETLVGVTDPQIIPPLLAVMKSGDETLSCRLAAINALDLFDNPELLDEFNSILDDEMVGGNAAYILAAKSNPAAHNMLLEALCSENRGAKLSAAAAIRRSADARAMLPLARLLEDEDEKFKLVALDSLSSLLFQPEGAMTDCGSDFYISEDIKRQVTASLIKTTQDDNKDIRGKALELLSTIDKSQAMPFVSAALEEFIQNALSDNYIEKSDYWDFDWFQNNLHGAIQNSEDIQFCEPLKRLIDAKSWHVKIDAVETLLILGDVSGTSVLMEALDNKNWIVRVKAAECLLRLGDSRAWKVLVKVLEEDVEDRWFIKWGIIDSLADSGDKRTFDLFIDILNNVDRYSIFDEVIAKVITWLGNTGDCRAIEPIKKWQYKELINCQYDVVEQALRSLGA